jgi:phosphoesterase RecJ-like protein
LRCSADLVDFGANPREIRAGLDIATMGDIMAQAEVLSRAEFFHDGRLAVATIPNKLYKKLDSGETRILMFLRFIKGVEFLVILKEAKAGETHVSIRSHAVPIRMIAEQLGGGGHDLAAGGYIKDNPSEAKKIIVEMFKGI